MDRILFSKGKAGKRSAFRYMPPLVRPEFRLGARGPACARRAAAARMTVPLNQRLDPNNRELIQQLLEDMRVIEDQFLGRDPKPSTIRTTFAPILRRWIAEGLFL